MSADALERYLEMAFDHFTTNQNEPFNFLTAALMRSPVSQTFEDHICKLAVHYMTVFPDKPGDKLFVEISPWVASCIFLNSHRFELPNNGKYTVPLPVQRMYIPVLCNLTNRGDAQQTLPRWCLTDTKCFAKGLKSNFTTDAGRARQETRKGCVV